MRFECPRCATSYTAERCGLALKEGYTGVVTIACVMCKAEFDVKIEPKTVTETPSWWARIVMRKQPVERIDGTTVVATLRDS